MLFPCKEMELLSSITNGEVDRVKQLVSSGISVNTVLHSQSRYESATVLGTAAYEGQIAIMKFLIESKALINYKDPWLGRNALHWACIGGHSEAVRLLLVQKIDINSCDRDNVTPLIFAAMFRWSNIIPALIEHGADVAMCDRLHSSALHYASFHGTSDIVSWIIKAGGVANCPVIFGQGTPLANLAYHQDFANCKMLIDAGYKISEDIVWILSDSASETDYVNTSSSLKELLANKIKHPQSLKNICRISVRKSIGGVHLEKKLCRIPLPKCVINYLRFS